MSVIKIMIKYFISRLYNSFLICVFLEQSENISWQLSFNGRKYHLFYWKLFRLFLNEERSGLWFVTRFVWKWQASSLEVMNQNQNGNINIYTAKLTPVIHIFLKITKVCFYTCFILEYNMYGGPTFL